VILTGGGKKARPGLHPGRLTVMTSIVETRQGAQMITSIGKHAVAAATVIAVGGLGAIAVQATGRATARAAGFSTTYTCSGPLLGTRSAVLDGWLTSPGQTAVNQAVGFRLHISSLGLGAPYPLDSWSASARVRVGGAEDAAFHVTGSGGYVPVGQPLSGDLSGTWAPAANGTHDLSVGGIAVNANTPAGNLTAYCAADEPRPVAETLAVFPVFQPGWSEPAAPPYEVVVPYRPGWNRPGWHRPIVVVPPYRHHGGGHRPHHPHGR
jgi:hypothetical protein